MEPWWATMLLDSKFWPNWLKRLREKEIQAEWELIRMKRKKWMEWKKEKWMRMPRDNNDAFIINK